MKGGDDDVLLVIYRPRRVGNRWVVTGKLHTPMGLVELRAEGNELLAAQAVERLQGEAVEVGGIFDDLKKAVRRVAQSKAFAQVMKGAQSVLSNPMFRQITNGIPIVSSVVTGADAAFAVAEGLRTGKLDASTVLQKAQQLAASANPELARKGAGILQGLNVAQTAGNLWAQYQAGDKNARRQVRALRLGAESDPRKKAALEAIKAARRFTLRQTAADIVQAAMNGDEKAGAKLEQIWQAAKTGDKHAREAARMVRAVVITRPTERAESTAEVGYHVEAARELLGEMTSVEGAPNVLTRPDVLMVRRIGELQAYLRSMRAA